MFSKLARYRFPLWFVISMVVVVTVTAYAESVPSLPERGVCAHRGASATHPENTLAAFREAIRLGAHMIEFDVYLTKDKHPVVIHDTTVDRTTNGTGRICDLTLAEIKELDAGAWKDKAFAGERVPTLDDALEIMPRDIWLNIHLKEGSDCGLAAARAIANANRLHQAFLACNALAADGARSVAPTILVCNMERQGGSAAYVDDTIARNAQFIQLVGVSADQLPGLVAKLKARGIHINYFGQEKPDQLRALFAAGVDFPLANDVAAALRISTECGIATRK